MIGAFVPTVCLLCPSSSFPQNYDLSISEAPKLFSDAEFEAVQRIQQALAVLLLRKRLKVINTAAHKLTPGLYTQVSPFLVECSAAGGFPVKQGESGSVSPSDCHVAQMMQTLFKYSRWRLRSLQG